MASANASAGGPSRARPRGLDLECPASALIRGRRSETAGGPRAPGPAVSVLRIRDPARPTDSARGPQPASTSSAVRPPSGPTTTVAVRGGRCGQHARERSPLSFPEAHARRRARRLVQPLVEGARQRDLGDHAAPALLRRLLGDALPAERAVAPARGSRRTTVRSRSSGTTSTTPSSVAMRMMASSLAPLGTPWASVTANGDSVERTARSTIRPPRHAGRRELKRTVSSCPCAVHRMHEVAGLKPEHAGEVMASPRRRR